MENFERFRWMCILSGCDYLDNIAGIGLVKAKKIMSKTQITNIDLVKLRKQKKIFNLCIMFFLLLVKIDS